MFPSATNDDIAHNPKSSASNTKDTIRDADGKTKDDLGTIANKAGQKVRGFIDSASDEFSYAKKTVSEHVHEKPMQSSLIALGIGFLLGALFRR